MMRSVFQFVSMLAVGVMTLGLVVVTLPWFNARAGALGVPPASQLQLGSAVVGLSLGLLMGLMGRYHWADIPRRLVTWVLVRERQFFYFGLIACCIGILLFY